MKRLALLVVTVLVVRILLSFLPSFTIDMNAWLGWSHRLNQLGTAQFYSESVWTQYTPGFLYWLLVIGKLHLAHPMAVKSIVVAADVLLAVFLYRLFSKKKPEIGNFGFSCLRNQPCSYF